MSIQDVMPRKGGGTAFVDAKEGGNHETILANAILRRRHKQNERQRQPALASPSAAAAPVDSTEELKAAPPAQGGGVEELKAAAPAQGGGVGGGGKGASHPSAVTSSLDHTDCLEHHMHQLSQAIANT